MKYDIYLEIFIYIYIYNPTHSYVSLCKIHTNSKQASNISERIYTNAYSAHLICSLILNSDWSKQVYFSRFWPSNSAAEVWSESSHKDLVFTTLLEASGRFWLKGEIRQIEVGNVKVWPYLIRWRC